MTEEKEHSIELARELGSFDSRISNLEKSINEAWYELKETRKDFDEEKSKKTERLGVQSTEIAILSTKMKWIAVGVSMAASILSNIIVKIVTK